MRGGAICAQGKNVEIRAGMSFRVGIKEVVGLRVVLIDAFLDQTHPEDAAVEIEILLRGAGDGGDVVQAVHGSHMVIITAQGSGSRLRRLKAQAKPMTSISKILLEP